MPPKKSTTTEDAAYDLGGMNAGNVKLLAACAMSASDNICVDKAKVANMLGLNVGTVSNKIGALKKQYGINISSYTKNAVDEAGSATKSSPKSGKGQIATKAKTKTAEGNASTSGYKIRKIKLIHGGKGKSKAVTKTEDPEDDMKDPEEDTEGSGEDMDISDGASEEDAE
ncbi:hypothetical protein BP5796_01098 [Coleophoma crateriformis]|uniref:Uncharacterized protein n=1 Tax=Coleophoma crateriformis TaxID=565419 RepID=A0A3D8T9X4_9HELO|nr:hypothetical protein BP5796_01098 [Coleophoma crateriformis]